MSLLQKLVKDLSLLAELHSLRKQLRTLQSVYELTVSDRDKKIADLEKQLEATKYYTNQYQKAFYRGIDYNDQLVEENGSLKEQLRVSNNEIIALKEQCRAATVECNKRDTEYKILSEQYDKLHKTNETLTTKLGKLELENNKLEINLSDKDFSSAYVQSELHTRNNNLIIQLESTKKDRDTYKDLATHNHKNNLRLIDKVKAIQEVVKVLEPVSMRFQTALFDLLDDTNVSGT